MIGLVQINTILMPALEEAKDSSVNGIVQRDHPTITCSMPNNAHDKVVSVTFGKLDILIIGVNTISVDIPTLV